jgi:hypothetical protein
MKTRLKYSETLLRRARSRSDADLDRAESNLIEESSGNVRFSRVGRLNLS